jgi:hypothetical protein
MLPSNCCVCHGCVLLLASLKRAALSASQVSDKHGSSLQSEPSFQHLVDYGGEFFTGRIKGCNGFGLFNMRNHSEFDNAMVVSALSAMS